jgi:hypothetical protein
MKFKGKIKSRKKARGEKAVMHLRPEIREASCTLKTSLPFPSQVCSNEIIHHSFSAFSKKSIKRFPNLQLKNNGGTGEISYSIFMPGIKLFMLRNTTFY